MELRGFPRLVTSSANNAVEKMALRVEKAKCDPWCQNSQLVAAVQKRCTECGNSQQRVPSFASSASVSALKTEKELLYDLLLELKRMKVERGLFTVHQTRAEQAASQTIEHETTDSAQISGNSFDVGKL
jgi:ribosomal protein L44E